MCDSHYACCITSLASHQVDQCIGESIAATELKQHFQQADPRHMFAHRQSLSPSSLSILVHLLTNPLSQARTGNLLTSQRSPAKVADSHTRHARYRLSASSAVAPGDMLHLSVGDMCL